VFFHDLYNLVLLEVSSSNIELTYALGDNWLLALDLEVELDILFVSHLDWLGTALLADGLDVLDNLLCLVSSQESEHVVSSHENHSFLLLLQLVSKLWQEREVKGWCLLLTLHVVEFCVSRRTYHEFHLQVKDLLVLLLGYCRKLLVFVKESDGGWKDLGLIDSPSVA